MLKKYRNAGNMSLLFVLCLAVLSSADRTIASDNPSIPILKAFASPNEVVNIIADANLNQMRAKSISHIMLYQCYDENNKPILHQFPFIADRHDRDKRRKLLPVYYYRIIHIENKLDDQKTFKYQESFNKPAFTFSLQKEWGEINDICMPDTHVFAIRHVFKNADNGFSVKVYTCFDKKIHSDVFTKDVFF